MFLYILTLFTPASMYVCINYLRSTFLTYTICRSWMRSSCHTYSSNISTRLLLHIPLQHTHIPLAKGLLENPRRTYNVVGSTGHHLYIALFLQECLRVRLAQFLPQNEDTFSTFLYFCHNEKNKMLHTYV